MSTPRYRITEEERQRRRDSIRATKPWLKSTGPRTPEGKAISSSNGLKHGCCSKDPALRLVGRVLIAEYGLAAAVERLAPIFEQYRKELDA